VDSVFVPLKESLMSRDYNLLDLFLNLECTLSMGIRNMFFMVYRFDLKVKYMKQI